MRRSLLLAAALAPLLMQTAGAQVAATLSDQAPAAFGAAADAGMAKPAKRAWARPAAINKPAPAQPAPEPPAPAPKAPDLVINSMDLDQIGRSAGTFAFPIAGTPAQVTEPAKPARAEPQVTARSTPSEGTVRIEPVAAAVEPTILLRVDPDVGLAAFRLGSEVLLVLDAPIGFQAPGADVDPAFASLISRRTQDATVIRIPSAPSGLRLAHTPRGWMVTAGPPGKITPILPRQINAGSDSSGVRFPVSGPSRVVTILNPQTGDHLLVGTQSTPGQAVPNEWQQPLFSLMPTLQGVVVTATSDDIRLRLDTDGFTLATSLQADSAAAGAKPKASDPPIAGAISRLFDIPSGTTKELDGTLSERIRAAGNAHALARSEPRVRVAEAMLALGMDIEAQSVIDVAAAADPALMDQPRAVGLRAAAATLAGRFEDTATLDDPRLTGTTEIELWRAFLQAAKDETTDKTARGLADGLPLVLAYPVPLRDRMLPRVLEAMALNGQAQAVLKTRPVDPGLDLARGMVLEAANQPADALKVYDQVATRDDRLSRYKAMVRAAELRLKTGEFDAKAAADALDRALLGWREPKQELALRLRIADLRQQAGQWREALSVLRDGRDALPEERSQIDPKMAEVFLNLLAGDAARPLSPADFVALYDQNLDLVQDIAWTEKTGTELVDRLVGLDLQARAEPIMVRLLAQSTDPVRRAVLGARLASLRMTINDPAGAIAALASTVPPADAAVDPAVMQARQLLYARGETGRGNKDRALSMLEGVDTADADELRAQIFADRKDWPRTIAALTDLEHKNISSGDLTDTQQAIVMRLAEAATLGADSSTLERLTESYGAAMAKSPSAALFRILTSVPAKGTDDLPRAFEEIGLAKQLQGSIGAAQQP